MKLMFNVCHQMCVRQDVQTAVADSVNYLTAKFTFETEDWNNTTKTAVFKNGMLVKNIILDANNECTVPAEVIDASYLYVSVFGVKEPGYRITTNFAMVQIDKSGYLEGDGAGEITPSQVEQLEGAIAAKTGPNDFKTINGQSIVGSGNLIIEGSGTEVVANPEGTATDSLTKIQIGEVIYNGLKGDKGNKGDKGDKGDDYVLTSADKAEIAQIVEGEIPAVEANPQGTASTDLTKLQIGDNIYAIPSGGGSAWIDERDILTRQLNVDTDMEVENIASEGDVFLYDNENLAVMTDIAETTSKDVTYKVENGLVYINGTASGSLHIYPTMVLPSWLKGCTLTAFVEVVSGTKTGTITFKTPYTYRKSDGTESQASMNTNATAKATVTTMNVNTTTVEFSVPTGAGGENLVLKPYIAIRCADYNSMSHVLLPAKKEAVSTTLSNKTGILMSMTADFSAHVKSKKRLPNLFGKRLIVCGDSVAYGAQGNPFGFTIAQNQNLSYENHAESGASISTYTPAKYIAGQIANLTGNYDLILCDGGYNDRAHQVAIGELTTGFDATLDETTLLGATEALCKSLITKYPTAKKLFVLVHKVANTSYVVDSGQQTYFDAIITALKKWNIPYIDLREYPLCAYNEAYANTYFNPTDFASNGGIHPNNAGYALGYVDQITAKLESI